MVRLRAFRAINDPVGCTKFIEGHSRILKVIGVEQVTSAKSEWMLNPNVYVIIAESTSSEKVYGGARVHIASDEHPLPIEEATKELDIRIHDVVRKQIPEGTAELCGLWNSREVAGMGIGSVFLTRAGVALASQLSIKSMFGLCAAYTVEMAQNVGFEVEPSVGNNGTFYYPKIDFLATAVFLKDIFSLDAAKDEERNYIYDLRKNPIQTRLESSRIKDFTLEYNLLLPVTINK